jgi:hypothetical protein
MVHPSGAIVLGPATRGKRRDSPATVVAGLTENGAPLLLRLTSPQVGHLLIAGDAGAGKSASMRALVASLAVAHRQEQLRLVLIDAGRHPVPSRSGTPHEAGGRCAFGPLAGLPNLLWPVLREPAKVIWALQSLVELTRERGRGRQVAETTDRLGTPRVVVAIDGLDGLLSLREARRALARLTRQGYVRTFTCWPAPGNSTTTWSPAFPCVSWGAWRRARRRGWPRATPGRARNGCASRGALWPWPGGR